MGSKLINDVIQELESRQDLENEAELRLALVDRAVNKRVLRDFLPLPASADDGHNIIRYDSKEGSALSCLLEYVSQRSSGTYRIEVHKRNDDGYLNKRTATFAEVLVLKGDAADANNPGLVAAVLNKDLAETVSRQQGIIDKQASLAQSAMAAQAKALESAASVVVKMAEATEKLLKAVGLAAEKREEAAEMFALVKEQQLSNAPKEYHPLVHALGGGLREGISRAAENATSQVIGMAMSGVMEAIGKEGES